MTMTVNVYAPLASLAPAVNRVRRRGARTQAGEDPLLGGDPRTMWVELGG